MIGLVMKEMGQRSKIVLAFVILGGVLLGIQTGVLQAVAAIVAADPIILGFVVLGLLLWWALDEAEDDDDASEIISKTADRAERRSKGFLDGTGAVLVGLVAIAGTVGTQLFDALVGVAGGALTAPLAAANLGVIAAIGGSILGLVSGTQVLVIAVALLIAGLVARRMD